MEVISTVIGILSLCLTCFVVGYKLGKDIHNKNNRPN